MGFEDCDSSLDGGFGRGLEVGFSEEMMNGGAHHGGDAAVA